VRRAMIKNRTRVQVVGEYQHELVGSSARQILAVPLY